MNETDEKLLPLGEPTLHFYPPPQNGPAAAVAVETSEAAPEKPVRAELPGVPSPKQQSWGAVISIVIIVLMIIIGAFYSWGKRIAEQQVPAISSVIE